MLPSLLQQPSPSSSSSSSTSSSHAASTSTSSTSSTSSSGSNSSSAIPKPTTPSPFFAPLPHTTWSPTAAALALTRDIASMNTTILADLHGLSSIPRIYTTLFHRTREFAATVRHFASVVASGSWAAAACLLVDWGVHVLRHPGVGLERFLNSQRESLYWILDDALLRICVDMWDPPSEQRQQKEICEREEKAREVTRVVPWDQATGPIVRVLAKAQVLVPIWGQMDVEETRKWEVPIYEGAQADWFEVGWFRRSRQFLRESSRIHEIWRTVRRAGKGQLPAELANVIVEDVAAFEELPLGDLRELYFPTGKRVSR
ncbi:hypothetical protein COCMIDRAFT_22526 [Bipolaris oryzae ATCC 44560]|uniref:Uncharacterized protein n=1 Tax=Bipolaris oryzae ATCC 44560 TaxID=930090 RepID=W6ZJ01_COCMI|nr:uncharacterized protein COCMIDRAFT_22526 [Bipolaris oryzae ATCC 44560]EUC49973.1 hypothetical protein COCMIDRAFT_22526 [Bipolaris oryzae ATCC 44560]